MSSNLSFQQLETYIREQMRMSHVYPPADPRGGVRGVIPDRQKY